MSSSVNPYRQAGRAAYTRSTNPSQEAARTQRSSQQQPTQEQSAAAASKSSAKTNGLQKAKAGPEALTAQEQQMIDQTFPEKPELSMRLYGRSRGTQTVNPGALGSRLDVQG